MGDRDWLYETYLPRWTLWAVLLLGPFGLLPIALSSRYGWRTRLAVTVPMVIAAVPLVLLAVVLARSASGV